MNVIVSLLLKTLRWPLAIRLAHVLAMHILTLGLYALAFPNSSLGGLMIFPLILSSWLFGWQGGLLSFISITVVLGTNNILASGTAFWTSASFTPFALGSFYGLVVCLIVGLLRLMTDTLLKVQHKIVDTEQAYEQEHALNELKDQVLQNLKHELRTPLTQIQGYLELLEQGQQQFDDETKARFFTYARNGCDELLSLIKTALETTTSTKQAQPCHPIFFSLQHEVQTVIAHFEPQLLHDRRIEVTIDASMQVYADPRFVRQVLRNLLTNACKYTPPQTGIIISAALVATTNAGHGLPEMIRVNVRDQGPGIAPEQQSLLFQRFVRLPNALESNQAGSGLGLAICKQLVEAMGGSIWVESSGRNGEGCCFSFTLANGSAINAKAYPKQKPVNNETKKEIDNGQYTVPIF